MAGNETIGERINRLRKCRNMTRKQLASAWGICESAVQQKMKGTTAVSVEDALLLTEILDVSLD